MERKRKGLDQCQRAAAQLRAEQTAHAEQGGSGQAGSGQAGRGQAPVSKPEKLMMIGAGKADRPQMIAVRQDRFDADKQTRFIAHLADTSNVCAAARAVGISTRTAYHHRRSNAHFARAWQQALGDGYADLVMKAMAQGRFGQKVVTTIEALSATERRSESRRDAAAAVLLAFNRMGSDVIAGTEEAAMVAEAQEEDRLIEAMVRVIERKARAAGAEDGAAQGVENAPEGGAGDAD
jgi:hypothetical protein